LGSARGAPTGRSVIRDQRFPNLILTSPCF
jgi:hypothetical protein